MSRQISIYKDARHLERLCHVSVWIESFLLLFFILFYTFVTFIIIEVPEDGLTPAELGIFIVVTVLLAFLWWLIFKYYAFDIVICVELQEDKVYLQSLYRTYGFKINDIVTLKESLIGENIIITFKTESGKIMKKHFKKYIGEGYRKVLNLNKTTLYDFFDLTEDLI